MRRHPALVHLSHDHHHALVVASHMRRADGGRERAEAALQYVSFMEGHAASHFREEEDTIFPLLAARSAESHAVLARAVAEHLELRAAALRFATAGGAVDAEALAAVGGLLEAHVRAEEREIFPLIERALSDAELESLAAPAPPPGAGAADLDVEGTGTLWAAAAGDLNATLVCWGPGEGVAEHRNSARDVLLVVLAGDGVVEVDGMPHEVAAHALVSIPKGSRRSATAGPDGLRYLSVHLRRTGLTAIRPRTAGARKPPDPLARAERDFEAYLEEMGDGVCLTSLPMRVDEIAGEAAGGDAGLEAEIAARLRRRAGLHA